MIFLRIYIEFTTLLFETRNWKDRFAKGPLDLAVNPLNSKNKSQIGPWPEVGEGGGGAGWIPASSVTGSEGPVGEKHEDSGSYLGMCSDGVGEAGRRLAGVSGGSPVVANSGGGAPAVLSGGERAGKLHESEGKPFRCWLESRKGGRGSSTASCGRRRRPWRAAAQLLWRRLG